MAVTEGARAPELCKPCQRDLVQRRDGAEHAASALHVQALVDSVAQGRFSGSDADVETEQRALGSDVRRVGEHVQTIAAERERRRVRGDEGARPEATRLVRNARRPQPTPSSYIAAVMLRSWGI